MYIPGGAGQESTTMPSMETKVDFFLGRADELDGAFVGLRSRVVGEGLGGKGEVQIKIQYVEYAKRGKEYGILFIFSLLCEYIHLIYTYPCHIQG